MSNLDQKFLQTLGIPVSKVAIALQKSRQTVNRGIQSEKGDFFKPPVLARALGAWRSSDPDLYAIAKETICDLYPEPTQRAVLEALQLNKTAPFAVMGGEYWLITGDFVGFRDGLRTCVEQLEKLCLLESAQITLFVNATKPAYSAANKLKKRFEDGKIQVFPCNDFDLSLVPTMLLRIDEQEKIHLYGVSDHGFVSLSPQEATRLRMVIETKLPHSKNAN